MTQELARRIVLTIGALLIFRLGCYVPLAGTSMQTGLISSGSVARISIFSLSIIPYLSAAIIIQLVSVVWGRVSALERSGEAGRRRIAGYTLFLTLLLAAFQAFGVASALQDVRVSLIDRRLVPAVGHRDDGGWRVLPGLAQRADSRATGSATALRSS